MKLTVASGARSLSAWRYAAERSSRWRESDSRRTMMRLLIVGLARSCLSSGGKVQCVIIRHDDVTYAAFFTSFMS
jgi:hypothetical protein